MVVYQRSPRQSLRQPTLVLSGVAVLCGLIYLLKPLRLPVKDSGVQLLVTAQSLHPPSSPQLLQAAPASSEKLRVVVNVREAAAIRQRDQPAAAPPPVAAPAATLTEAAADLPVAAPPAATQATAAQHLDTQTDDALTADIRRRCQGTLGDWCGPYLKQQGVPGVTAPPGNKTCHHGCNGVGNCNMLLGVCQCPAGWTGDWCIERMRRPCASKYHYTGYDADATPGNVSEGIDKPSHWAFPASHCSGTCDDDIAACFCKEGLPYGRVPAAADAPAGAPPVQFGRPMGQYCQPNQTEDGTPSNWGTVDPDLLFNPEYGWCMAKEPRFSCICLVDGMGGPTCETPYQQTCMNQCNGHGECRQGFCKCHEGWFGHDCAHRAAGVDGSPGLASELPWVAENVHTPAAESFPPGSTRKRPLIYVYELPSIFNTVMLQYRMGGADCVPRLYDVNNVTTLSGWAYALESALHEMLLQSEHRTLNPEEADFFYVPIYTSCFIFPVRDHADYPWFYSVLHNRAQGSTNMQLEAWHWLRSHLPYWDRRGGKDHIWFVNHDEASCYVPAAVRPAIILSHWGRKDLNHASNTGYSLDNYSAEFVHPQYEPKGFQQKIAGHACYDPSKDIILPTFKRPDHYRASPLLGAPARERTYLCIHRGRVQPDNPKFSRGLRQRLAKAAQEGRWLEKHRIAVGGYDDIQGEYTELLASSTFCLVIPGDGFTTRMEDSVLHGCLPVIIMDNVDVSWATLLDLDAFTLRIPEADAEQLPQILSTVAGEAGRVERMQRALSKPWRRFAWSSYRPYARLANGIMASNQAARQAQQQGQQQQGGGAAGGSGAGLAPLSLPEPEDPYDPSQDDAFDTLMQWLFTRIPDTR